MISNYVALAALVLACSAAQAGSGWYDWFEPPFPPPLTTEERATLTCFQNAPWVDRNGEWKRRCVARVKQSRHDEALK